MFLMLSSEKRSELQPIEISKVPFIVVREQVCSDPNYKSKVAALAAKATTDPTATETAADFLAGVAAFGAATGAALALRPLERTWEQPQEQLMIQNYIFDLD